MCVCVCVCVYACACNACEGYVCVNVCVYVCVCVWVCLEFVEVFVDRQGRRGEQQRQRPRQDSFQSLRRRRVEGAVRHAPAARPHPPCHVTQLALILLSTRIVSRESRHACSTTTSVRVDSSTALCQTPTITFLFFLSEALDAPPGHVAAAPTSCEKQRLGLKLLCMRPSATSV